MMQAASLSLLHLANIFAKCKRSLRKSYLLSLEWKRVGVMDNDSGNDGTDERRASNSPQNQLATQTRHTNSTHGYRQLDRHRDRPTRHTLSQLATFRGGKTNVFKIFFFVFMFLWFYVF